MWILNKLEQINCVLDSIQYLKLNLLKKIGNILHIISN